MTWEDKTELVRLLNNNENKNATQFYLEHENWKNWDDVQGLMMYANGIDLSNPEDCRDFESTLKTLQTVFEERYSYLDFRGALRLSLLQELWEEKDKSE